MKQYLNILLSLFLTITSCQPAFAQTKVDGSLLKGDVIGGTASNTRRIVVPKDTKANLDAKTRLEANLVYGTDTKKAYIDNGTSLVAVGSGSGGAVNLITDGDAENAISSIFVPYDDGAVAFPIDGSGAGATVTTSITSTNPLTGAKSYLLTKPASVVQGQGWSIPFTVDPSYRAKVLKISIDYIVNSGTFTAGSSLVYSDIIWYVYDVTNSKLIEPSSTRMFSNSSTISSTVEATFQTSATGSSYRLIAHMATGFSTAFELKIDNVTVSPSVYVYGTPVTDPKTFTSTPFNFGNGTVVASISRSGAFALIEGTMTVGSTLPTGIFGFSLPSGLTADYSQVPKGAIGGDTYQLVGTVRSYQSPNNKIGIVQRYAGSLTQFQFSNDGSSDWSTTAPVTWVAGSVIEFEIKVQILGWSSSVQMSDSADTRILAAKYTLAVSTSITGGSPINFATKVEDTHGAVTTGAAWKFTAPISGLYSVTALQNANSAHYYRVYKNGVADDYLSGAPAANYMISGKAQIRLNAGEYIDVRPDASVTTQSVTYITIERISGPSAIAASETVNAVYTTAAGQSIPNATDTIIDFGTAEINSHGNVVTGAAWKFTAQISGVYEVSAFVQFLNGGAWNTAEDGLVSIFKNGSNFTRVGNTASTATHGTYVPIPCATRQIRLLAGDYIDLRAYQTSGSALTLAAAATLNWVSIKRVGN